MSRLSGFRSTRFGASSGASRRTSRWRKWNARSAVTLGRLRQSKHSPSWSFRGWLDGGTPGVRRSSFRTLQAAWRTACRLTTDGHKMYLNAVVDAFADDIDYAQLVKVFGNDPEGQRRYTPAQCLGTKKEALIGSPDPAHISTSYIERQNLTMRMNMRRFTGLTNAFSKKIENHMHSVALFYMYCNFVRIHQTLRVTPAMEAGICQRAWSIYDIVSLACQSSITSVAA